MSGSDGGGGTAYLLRVVDGPDQGRQTLVRGCAVVGRDTGDLSLSDPHVSRRHAEVSAGNGRVLVRDLGSRRGTWIAGREITGEHPLRPGDTFRLEPDTVMLLSAQQPPSRDPAQDRLELLVREPGRPARRRPLGHQPVRIGRGPEADLVLSADVTVSALHAELRPRAGQLVLTDLGSSHGTCLNDETVEGEIPVAVGDTLLVGRTEITLVSPSAGLPPAPPPLQLLVQEEGGSRPWAVSVTASGTSTVADVSEALADHLGLVPRGPSASQPGPRQWCLYRRRGAFLPNPATRWAEADLRRGDVVVVGPLTGAAEEPVRTRSAPPAGPAGSWRIARRGLPGTAVVVTPHPVHAPQVPEPVSWRGKGVFWQIAGGLGMVGVGVGMAFVNPAFLVLAVLGGIATLWSIFAGLLGERARAKRAVVAYRARLVELDEELAAVRTEQAERLHRASPPVSACLGWPASGARQLWRRRPSEADFLALRLGTGQRPAALALDSFSLRSTSPLAGELTDVLDRHRLLADVPITSPPAGGGVLGVTGEAVPATALARSLVVQAAALHSPTSLPVAVLACDDAESWTRWLPHVEAPDGVRVAYTAPDADALAARLAPGLAPDPHGGQRAVPRMLLLVDAAAAARPPVRALLDTIASGTALAVVLAPRDRLPATTTVMVECRGSQARLVGPSIDATPFGLEGVTVEQAADFASTLAPFTDEDAVSVSTRTVAPGTGLLALIGIDDPSRADPDQLWSGEPPVPFGAPVGVTDTGAVLELSLLDGPHGLIAGTTGSGKSEFLQSFLAGLAATHSPDDINFFLVDFKGGATFNELARLPHVVGMVTNLEGPLAERAVTSLKVELNRRQSILADARIKEFPDYRPDPSAGRPPLPRLLLVIDEFAMLLKELPDVVDRFKEIATVGRSLGVHMLLATQSAASEVTGKIEANVNLKVCLRMANAQESMNVLGRNDAADIPPKGAAGRGFLRFGGSLDITGFQTARIAGPLRRTASGAAPVTVTPFADARPVPARPVRGSAAVDSSRTELDVLTEALAERAAARGVTAPRALWLPPLQELVDPASLDPLPDLVVGATGRRRRADLRLRLGRADEPEDVTQPVAEIDLAADGHLLVLGAYGAGKTSTLRHVAAELAGRLSPARLHLYGIDAGDDSLGPLLALPHTADVVGADDLERLLPMFARLERIVAQRRAAVAGDPEPAAVVLLLDDLAAFRETADGFQYGVLYERLVSLVRSGPAAGVHVVMSAAQRTDLPSSLFNLLPRKVMLRQADLMDFDLIGVPPPRRPGAPPPGRAMVSGPPPREVQVAWTDPAALTELGRTAAPAPADEGPRPIRRLPADLLLSSVTAPADDGALRCVLGVGGPELEPVVHEADRDGPVLLVAGGERTGRSTTLLTAAAGWRAARPDLPLTVLALRRSPVQTLGDLPGVTLAATPDEATAALQALAARPAGTRAGLLVDDLEGLGDLVLMALEPVLRAARESGLVAAVAGRVSDLTRAYDPSTRYLRSLRATLLLVPRPEDGELIGTRIPAAIGPQVPGRGLLFTGSAEPVRMQVARPD